MKREILFTYTAKHGTMFRLVFEGDAINQRFFFEARVESPKNRDEVWVEASSEFYDDDTLFPMLYSTEALARYIKSQFYYMGGAEE